MEIVKFFKNTLLLLLLPHGIYCQGYIETGETFGISYDFLTDEYGGGVSFVDFNQDGLDDLTYATARGEYIRFHLNTGTGFMEINPLILDTSEVKQILWVDFNNDGLLDLYITSVQKNRLYKNTGSLNFVDITETCGFSDPDAISYCATWFDYDKDGLLDVAVAHRTPEQSGKITLYKNLGNEQFIDFTLNAGLKNKGNSVLAMTSFDYNNDGWSDLFLAQDFEQGNQLLKNNGNGTFRDISYISNTNQKMNSMTATVGDYNSDGWFDIYVTNTTEGNILLKNEGNDYFSEVSGSLGVDIRSLTFGSIFLDADNDMDLDLMVFGFQNNYIYENKGSGTSFVNVTNDWGFSAKRYFNNGAAAGDFNTDGFVDIAISSLSRENFTQSKNTFWQNNFTDNNYLVINLIGTVSNKNAIGALLEININGKIQKRRIGCGESYSSQQSFNQFFGLGTNSIIDELKIYWPSGTISIENNLLANQKITITEPLEGCMDPLACNFNPIAQFDNNSCRYATINYNCSGCINDSDEDGVCDELEIFGCTDIYSCNYNSNASEEDGSCWYVPEYTINGNSNVAPLILEQYSYIATEGSTYEWSIENGTIVMGQGSPNVSVFWLIEGNGKISVSETKSNCTSANVSLLVNSTVLGKESIEKKNILIYPNPATTYLNIEKGLWNKYNVTIMVIDFRGKVIDETSNLSNKETIDLTNVSNGIYYIKLSNGFETIVSKFMVEK